MSSDAISMNLCVVWGSTQPCFSWFLGIETWQTSILSSWISGLSKGGATAYDGASQCLFWHMIVGSMTYIQTALFSFLGSGRDPIALYIAEGSDWRCDGILQLFTLRLLVAFSLFLWEACLEVNYSNRSVFVANTVAVPRGLGWVRFGNVCRPQLPAHG